MNPDKSYDFIALTGASASGKSALAMALAQKWGDHLMLISLDSVAVYQHLDIGSAKPSKDLLKQYPHSLIDVCDFRTPYTVANFLSDAHACILECKASGRVLLLVGGTMMYLHALIHGLHQMPSLSAATHEATETIFETQGRMALFEACQKADAAFNVPPENTQRLKRAFGVLHQTGKPLSWHQHHAPLLFPALRGQCFFYSPLKRRMLDDAIKKRTQGMLESGLIEEVSSLLAMLLPHETLPPSLQSIGYKEVCAYLRGRPQKEAPDSKHTAQEEADKKKLARTISEHVILLVKRQYTWKTKLACTHLPSFEAPYLDNFQALDSAIECYIGAFESSKK